jgi:hypothetical protein
MTEVLRGGVVVSRFVLPPWIESISSCLGFGCRRPSTLFGDHLSAVSPPEMQPKVYVGVVYVQRYFCLTHPNQLIRFYSLRLRYGQHQNEWPKQSKTGNWNSNVARHEHKTLDATPSSFSFSLEDQTGLGVAYACNNCSQPSGLCEIRLVEPCHGRVNV